MDLKVDLYNVLLKENIPADNLKLMHWRRLIKRLDPNSRSLSSTDFNEEFFMYSNKNFAEILSRQEWLLIIFIQVGKVSEGYFYIGVAISRAGVVRRLASQASLSELNLKENFEPFCNSCLQYANNFCKKKIVSMIFDIEELEILNDVKKEINIQWKYDSFRVLSDNLIESRVELQNPLNQIDKLAKYNDFLQKFQNRCRSGEISLSDAADDIIDAIETEVLTINANWHTILSPYVTSIFIAAHYVNSLYKDKIIRNDHLEPFKNSKFMLSHFFNSTCPPEAKEIIAQYKLNSRGFDFCRSEGITDPSQIWQTAAAECEPLVELVEDLLNIPAAPKRFNLQALFDLHKKKFANNISRLEYVYNTNLLLQA